MADSKESFEILENGSGDGVSPTASQIGEASGGKIGMTVFGFRDASGVLRMPEVNGSNVLKTDGSAVTQPVSGTVTANVGTTGGIALETTQTANGVLIGAVTETAPGTDTASSGLNGRLQRIAQRLTSLIALLPTSIGAKTVTGSLSVTLATDEPAIEVVGNVASAAADSGNPVKTSGVYNATLPTVTTGQRVNTQTNQFGETAIVSRNLYRNIAGAQTVQVKTGAGRLHTIAVNAVANATVTVYDNTASAAPIIATISLTNGVSNPTLIYDVEFTTGLRIMTTGAATNITVSYQ
jgi:hypothetical protein